jgi:hypothetical protein
MRRTYVTLVLLGLILLTVSAALAQGPALQGTVTLRGGKTLQGEIKVAQVGVVQGSGIGTLLPGMGSFKLKIDDQLQEVKAADMAQIEITWGLANPADPQSWEIKQIAVVKRDGTRVTGKPSWGLQASSAVVGDLPALYAFPKGEGFSADNLVTKVEIAGAMPSVIAPPATTPPATVPPATTPPATVPPATVPPATTPPATTPPVEVTPPATVPPATTPPAVVTPPAAVAVPAANGAYEVVVTDPATGKQFRVRIQVEVVPVG